MLTTFLHRRLSTTRPQIHNFINDHYVIRGKERLVGGWLLGVSASVLAMVLVGGYTRLSKSGFR